MKKKQRLLTSAMMLFCVGLAQAQVYTYVQQNDVRIDKLGTAAFVLSSSPAVEFDENGNAVMTIDGNTVARLPMSDSGQLVVELNKPDDVEESELNKVTKTFTTPFATIYSPFQLSIPDGSGCNVYDPSYTSGNTVELTEIDGIVPVETPLILQNAGIIEFGISAGASTAEPSGNFSGSSLKVSVPTLESDQTIYTLGHEKHDATRYGFFPYSGTTLGAGLCYLKAATLSNARAIYFDGYEEETGIGSVNSEQLTINSEQLTINRGSTFYNVAGQYTSKNAKGIIIMNGKKFINK